MSHELIAPCIDLLRETEEVVVEEDRIYIPSLYYAEKGVATRVHQFSSIRRVETRNIDAEIAAIEKRDGIRFASLQKVALEKALSHSLLVLTGGPGTGKTTTIRGLIALFEARDKGVLLAAPTGRAAKRMAEATGRDAKTIHRLLKFSPGELKFDMNFDNPLTCDAIIVDEVSMVDVALMNSLLQAGTAERYGGSGGGRGPAAFGGAGECIEGYHRLRGGGCGGADRDFPAGAGKPDCDERTPDPGRRTSGIGQQPGFGFLFLAGGGSGGSGRRRSADYATGPAPSRLRRGRD